MENRKPLVIYHKDCADGLAAAWCFWKQFKDKMEYHPGVYNEEMPDVHFRDVYLVDFSYKRHVVEEMLKYADKVILLDHHASAIDDLWDLKHPDFDMSNCNLEHSGAMIAWNYVKKVTGHRRQIPKLIQHIEDRDLWKFKYENTRTVMAAVFSYPFTLESYDRLMTITTSRGIKNLVKEGVVIERKYQQDLNKILEGCVRPFKIGDHIVPCACANYMYASDIGNKLAQDALFGASYYDTEKHRVFSLRSIGDFDVSKIALMYNGGGHKNASGFKVPRDHELAKT